MRSTLLLIGIMFGLVATLQAADIDVQLLGSVPLGAKPRQIVATADGQRIYVLTETGQVLLYDDNGQLQGNFEVGPDVTRIAPFGPNRLILQMSERKEMTVVALEPVVAINTADAPTLGNPDAPVAIVVFDDFECPYCARAVPLLKQAQSSYGDKVKLVYKNFPLSSHRNARTAATAALAAQRQGKFWPLYDLLYENYNQLNPQKIRDLAAQVGLDMARFDQDMKDQKLQQRIDADLQEGQQAGVHGTPTIFINGHLLQERSMAGFKQLIDAELTKLAAKDKESK